MAFKSRKVEPREPAWNRRAGWLRPKYATCPQLATVTRNKKYEKKVDWRIGCWCFEHASNGSRGWRWRRLRQLYLSCLDLRPLGRPREGPTWSILSRASNRAQPPISTDLFKPILNFTPSQVEHLGAIRYFYLRFWKAPRVTVTNQIQ